MLRENVRGRYFVVESGLPRAVAVIAGGLDALEVPALPLMLPLPHHGEIARLVRRTLEHHGVRLKRARVYLRWGGVRFCVSEREF